MTGLLAWLDRMRRDEPARFRGVVAASFLVVAAVGIALPTDLPAAVDALLLALPLLPLGQGEATRAAVTPAERVEEVKDEAYRRGLNDDTGAGLAAAPGRHAVLDVDAELSRAAQQRMQAYRDTGLPLPS